MASTASMNYVNALYTGLLGYSGDAAGVEGWASQIDAGASPYNVAYSFYQAAYPDTSFIALTYQSALGRLPDVAGYNSWLNSYRLFTTGTVEERQLTITKAFYDSTEFAGRVGGDPTTLAEKAYVEALYKNVLGRNGDAGGVDYWTAQLTAREAALGGTDAAKDQARNELLQDFVTAPETMSVNFRSVNTFLTYAEFVNRAPTAAEFTAAPEFLPQLITGVSAAGTIDNALTVVNDTGAVFTSLIPLFASLAANPTSIVEGTDSTFTVTTNIPVLADTTYNISVVGDTLGGSAAAASNADFSGLPTSVALKSNTATGSFVVTPVNDNTLEGTEGFKVTLLNGATPVVSTTALITDAVVDKTAPTIATGQKVEYGGGQKAGDVLGQVTITDDTAVTGVTIVSGDASGFFAINTKGEVSLTDKGAAAGAAPNDFAVLPNTFDLVIQAVDGAGNKSIDTTITLAEKDTVPPALSTASLTGSSLVMTFNEPLDQASIPAGNSFTVLQGGNTGISVNSVAINGSTVTLGLAAVPAAGVSLTVAYNPPSANPLQDVAGNDVVIIPAKNVVVDNTAPSITTFSPADEATAVATTVSPVLTFSEAVFLNNGTITLTNPTTPTDTRVITIENGAVKAGSAGTVSISDKAVTLDFTADLTANINYSLAISNGAFKDAAGNTFAGGGVPTGDGYDFTTAPVTAQDFTLTTGVDIFPGTLPNGGNDVLRGVAGQPVGQQDQTTLNSSDVLDGGAGSDTLVLILNGNYGGGATIKNIETLQIGSNTQPVGGVAFDYNVNQGVFEVTGVNTIVIDQITNGEILNVTNLVPTAAQPANVTPTLSWENEAGSRAGTFGVTYRQSAITGTADNQAVVLKNVNAMNAGDGILNIAGGMETITIESTGTVTNNTLNNSANLDTGSNAGPADVISAGSLTKVVLKGGVTVGKAGGVVTDTTGGRSAFQGQTDRAVGADTGLTADATTNPTESNLLSVGSRVTEVDASAMTAAANVRFIAKTDASPTNVTFKGGNGNDYVEFELGNVNATGGNGDDTFAFINAGANSTFGEADVIVGGAGNDTLQLGLNGNAQTYNIGETELTNVSGVDTIDLRGQTHFLTLSSGVVSKADTANVLTVRTDKIIQGSATDPANPTDWLNNGLENAATATVNLTKLTSGQGVIFMGGSGSDRLILSDATFNANQNLDGGVYGDTAVRAAGSNRYDTITVVTNGENVVLDGNDLGKVKNFEGFVLTKNAAAATYNLTLTKTFVTNNTQASNNPNTAINDTIFQIGTSAAANNAALAAGDTVIIDIRDLLNATDAALAAGFSGRFVDVTALENAGVTVTFIGNTGNLTLAQARASTAVVANNTDANFADVTTLSAANPGAAGVGNTLLATGAAFNTTSGFLIQGGVLPTVNSDTLNSTAAFLAGSTINLATGAADTLNITDNVTKGLAAGVTAAINVATIDIINVVAGTGTTGITTSAAAGQRVNLGASSVVTLGAAGTVVGSTGADTITGSAGNDTLSNGGGAGADSISGGGGVDTYNITGTGNATVVGWAGIDTLVATGTGGVRFTGAGDLDVVTFNAANGAVDRVVFADAAATPGIVALADRDAITGFNATNDIIVLDTVQTTVGTAAGAPPVIQAVAASGALLLASATADITVLNFDIGGVTSVLAGVTNGSALLANLGGALTAAANTDDGYILAYDNGNAFLYAFTNPTAAGVVAAEIRLIGTFNGVATGALGIANFALEV